MSSLTQVLLDPAKRPAAVAALADVVDQEVAGRGGLSGAALKTAFAGAKKLKEGLVPKAVDKMLPEFASQLDPFWADRGDQPFGPYLASRGDDAANALLAVADAKAADPEYSKYSKIYGTIRPKAQQYVVDALPRLGAAIETLMA